MEEIIIYLEGKMSGMQSYYDYCIRRRMTGIADSIHDDMKVLADAISVLKNGNKSG